jgi:hypothetical protein
VEKENTAMDGEENVLLNLRIVGLQPFEKTLPLFIHWNSVARMRPMALPTPKERDFPNRCELYCDLALMTQLLLTKSNRFFHSNGELLVESLERLVRW